MENGFAGGITAGRETVCGRIIGVFSACNKPVTLNMVGPQWLGRVMIFIV